MLLCLMDREGTESGTVRWVLGVVAHLLASQATYVSVLSRHQLGGGDHLTDAGGREDVNEDPRHLPLTAPPAITNGLVVQRVMTQDDEVLFQKMYEGQELGVRWLVVCGSHLPHLTQHYFPINNNVVLATVSDERVTAALWETYQASPHLQHHTQQLGRWTLATPPGQVTPDADPGNQPGFLQEGRAELLQVEKMVTRYGVLEAPRNDPIINRRNLTGLHLRCTTIEFQPMTLLTQQQDGSVVVTGVMGDILTLLHDLTNFTYRCEVVKDHGWGTLLSTGWSGMIGEVVRDEADIAVAALDITEQRESAVDFLLGFIYAKYQLVMRRPSSSDVVWRAYTKQFEGRAWAAAGMVVMLAIMVTVMVVYCSRRRGIHLTLSDTLITVTAFLVGQGADLSEVPTSLRMVSVSCMLLHMLLLQHYTSDLITALAVGPPLPAITNLEDINRSPSLTLGYLKGSSLIEYFRDSPAQVYQRTYQTIVSRNFDGIVESMDEGIERVLKEAYVFMEWEVTLFYKFGQDCRLYRLPTGYFPAQASFALKKGSPLVPVFNNLLMELLSAGIVKKAEEQYTPHNIIDCNQLQTEPIQLKTLFTVFLMLGGTLVISFLILAGEILRAKFLFGAPRK
ncbi:probable glutamate receptor [Cherax quadricarinatus]